MNFKLERAADSLISYFKMIFEGAGMRWDSDNQVEIYGIVEDIFEGIDAVVNEKIDTHIQSRYHAE